MVMSQQPFSNISSTNITTKSVCKQSNGGQKAKKGIKVWFAHWSSMHFEGKNQQSY